MGWLILHWGILPRVDVFRPQIEQRAAAALGVPLRIGAIEVRSSGWVPALTLREVVLQDRAGHDALKLPVIAAALSPRSLLAFELRLEQLFIEQPDLEVRRDREGRLHVAGIELGAAGAGPSDTSALDWVLRQHEVVVRGGRVRWIDELRDAPPLQLGGVELVLRNRLRGHALRLDATPPDDWGERFSLRGQFTQPLFARAADWQRWTGTLYAELPRADVHELHRHVELPLQIHGGRGALRAWAELQAGELKAVTADVALSDVDVQAAESLQPLRLARLSGRVVAQQDAASVKLAARSLAFVTGDGVDWPASDIELALERHRDKTPGPPFTGGRLDAQRIDLGVAAQIASRLPLGSALQRLLDETRPRGIATALHGSWEGSLDAPRRYRVQGRLDGLAMAAGTPARANAPARPGLRDVSLQIDANEQGGTAVVAFANGALDLPGLFDEPLVPLAEAAARVRWRLGSTAGNEPAPLELQITEARFANDDARGELQATWRSGPHPLGTLDLSGRIEHGRARSVARYLPLEVDERARRYVQEAVLGGTVRDVSFKVKGELTDFPFYRPGRHGEFRIAGHVDDGILAYVPPAIVPPREGEPEWPVFTDVSGELVFDRASMTIRDAQARVYGLQITQVQGGIEHLFGGGAALAIDGAAHGPLAEGLRYVRSSPVGGWIGHALDKTTAAGNADLKLSLLIPLDDAHRSSVRGSVQLAGNELRLLPEAPLMSAARGRMDFTQKGFTLVGTGARVLGGDASFDGGTQPDGSVRFNAQGVASADGLRAFKELAPLARFAQVLQGQTGYTAQLAWPAGVPPEWTIASTLQGMAIDLPEPMRKPADAVWPSRLQVSPVSGEGGPAARDLWRVEVGNGLQLQYLRDVSGPTARVLRGAIALREPLPDPAQGVQANLRLERFDVDAWLAAARSLSASPSAAGSAGAAGTGAAAGTGGAAAGASLGDAAAYLPAVIGLQARELRASGRRLNGLVAGVQHQPGDESWRATLRADQLEGQLEYRPAHGAGAQSRLVARLTRLALPPGDADSVGSMLEQNADLPALDIWIDDFDLRGKKLGRVEVEAASRGSGEAREWLLSRLSMTMPEAELGATGRWAAPAPGAPRRMTMDFRLDLADSGAFLERLGMGRVLSGGKGRMEGQVSWAGSPLSFDVPSLAGQLHLALDAGQFLNASPGGARLLGVLSLQSLPRRLTLDFRDVFDKGFAFDNVSGDARIERGVASTNNLRMRGLQAAVLMEGSADVGNETQDLRVIVVPEIDASTASLAYAAINPAIGLGTFVAQWFLRKPLMAAGTREFHVSGSWSDPKVERVHRSLGQGLPEIPPPAAAASSPTTPP